MWAIFTDFKIIFKKLDLLAGQNMTVWPLLFIHAWWPKVVVYWQWAVKLKNSAVLEASFNFISCSRSVIYFFPFVLLYGESATNAVKLLMLCRIWEGVWWGKGHQGMEWRGRIILLSVLWFSRLGSTKTFVSPWISACLKYFWSCGTPLQCP